jgi:formate dehydrogenase maturation protein FdhE
MLTVLEALAEAAQRESELVPYYELHRALLELQETAGEEITATLEMVDDEALRARTLQGLPVLSFDQLPIKADHFARLATEIAEVLVEHEVEVRDGSLPGTDPEWVSLAQRRFEAGQVVEEGERDEEQQEAEATLAQIATDQALKPYLAWAAEQVLSCVDQDHWKRGYCPVCGGAPDFAALETDTGARNLLCSRCNSQWIYRRVGCPFCGITDHTQLMYYPSEDEVYRLYVCQACQRYLKTIDLRKATRKVLLTLERIATVAMDAAAQQEGYR